MRGYFFSKIFFCLLLSGFTVSSQWIQSSGPPGGSAYGLLAVGDTLYTGNYSYNASGSYPQTGTFYKSTDHGQNWVADSNGIQGTIQDITNIGDTLFAATFQNSFFRKIGSTWTNLIAGQGPYNLFAYKGVLYGAFYNSGVMKSTDYGNTFNFFGNYALTTINKMQAIDDTIYAATSHGIYSSRNGQTWQPLSNKVAKGFTISNNTMFLLTWTDSIFRSTDFGVTWNSITPVFNGSTSQIFSTGDTLMVTVKDTINHIYLYRSFDAGSSWNPSSTTIPISGGPDQRFAKIGNEIFTSLTSGSGLSIMKTTDYGNTWTEANRGLPNLRVFDVYDYHGTLFAGSDNVNILYKSVYGGTTWQSSSNGINNIPPNLGQNTYIEDIASNDSFLFVCNYGAGVARSSDSGHTWTNINNGLNQNQVWLTNIFACDSFQLITNGIVFRSTDNGLFWDSIAYTTFGNFVYFGNKIFIAGVYQSSDYGLTWSPSDSGIPLGVRANEVIIRGNDMICATTHGLYISSDTGATWNLYNNAPQIKYNSIVALGDTIIAAAWYGNYSGVMYISYDDGYTWHNYDRPGFSAGVIQLRIIGDSVFACTTNNSIWKRFLYDTTIVTKNNKVIKVIDNLKIFPVPARNLVRINFDSNVNLEKLNMILYNIMGEVVFSVSHIRTNSVDINISNYKTGIYFLKVESSGSSVVRKIIVE